MKSSVIEYRGHEIAHIDHGRWDAYLECDNLIYWDSPCHSTLTEAKAAIDQRLSRLYRQRRRQA